MLSFIQGDFPKDWIPQLRDLLLSKREFTRLHLSLFYPFLPEELEKFCSKLIWGSNHYSTFVWDVPKQQETILAELGLAFNQNLHPFSSKEISDLGLTRFKEVNEGVKKQLPLHLGGELENRFATASCFYSRKPLQPTPIDIYLADSVLTAHNLYYFEGGLNTFEEVKTLIDHYGVLAAFCKRLWDEFFLGYITPAVLSELMEEL